MNGLGTKYQYNQLNLLPCRKYILATDNDAAGYSARIKLRHNIKNKIITEVQLPDGRKDINDCTLDELQNLFEKF